MIIWILIMTCLSSWDNATIDSWNTFENSFSTKREAVIRFYSDNSNPKYPNYYKGKLYKVDLVNKTIEQVPIPMDLKYNDK